MKNIILLSRMHGSVKWFACKKTNHKSVENNCFNQVKLINNLNRIIRQNTSSLLDSHNCLINKLGKPEKILINTFKKIAPKKLVLIITDSKVINTRFEKRENILYHLEFIQSFQTLEIQYSHEIRDSIEIPLLIFESLNDKYGKLLNFIR